MSVLKFDFLIIGSGIAGLTYAIKVSEYGKVCIVTKNMIDDTATRYAQGGIAAVIEKMDSYEKHVSDTMIAGCGLNDKDIVEKVIVEGPKRINELMNWGAQFDRNKDGSFDLGKEGGHSEHRILHSKDSTGNEIQKALINQVKKHPNISILNNHFAVDIITQHHLGELVKRANTDIECYGAYVLDNKTNEVVKVLAKSTLIATGGAGNVYLTTTNPIVSTGDGIAMVYRAKGIVKDMEFVQFHPTSLYNPGEKPSFLITEALRGFGAVLKNHSKQSFMERYDKRGSLAPRDIVARAIDNEMKMSGEDYMFLDATICNANELIDKFPNIFKKCNSIGIDITKEYIPVVPAAHYICGGIKVNEFGQTTIKNLYAAGEAAYTGMHGANRLASNSLLEALVFANISAEHALTRINGVDFKNGVPDWDVGGTIKNEEMILITQSLKEVKQIMTNYVGIVRSNLRLKRALDRLEIIYIETEALYKASKITMSICELRNIINVAYLIIKMARERKQSVGLHYSLDYLE
jgi:L-aspartate oxidase